MNYAGFLIRQKRLEKGWSQEGLCRGVCAVSYLSKIEQGKADGSDEIVGELMRRLGCGWFNDENDRARAAEAVECGYEAMMSLDTDALRKAVEKAKSDPLFLNGPYALDFLLQMAAAESDPKPLDDRLSPCFDARQAAVQAYLAGDYSTAYKLYPCALFLYAQGANAYERGGAMEAVTLLERAYSEASAEGRVFLMMECCLLIGNCYSNSKNIPAMLKHYGVGKRLAKALRHENALSVIDYNIASTRLECGEALEAYNYFSKLDSPDALCLHKLAIACEKMGKYAEAAAAIERAESVRDSCKIDSDTVGLMLDVVKYRITHTDYIHDENYGTLLTECFERCSAKLHAGYAAFHLPWMLEWLKENRRYKQAAELLESFPR